MLALSNWKDLQKSCIGWADVAIFVNPEHKAKLQAMHGSTVPMQAIYGIPIYYSSFLPSKIYKPVLRSTNVLLEENPKEGFVTWEMSDKEYLDWAGKLDYLEEDVMYLIDRYSGYSHSDLRPFKWPTRAKDKL